MFSSSFQHHPQLHLPPKHYLTCTFCPPAPPSQRTLILINNISQNCLQSLSKDLGYDIVNITYQKNRSKVLQSLGITHFQNECQSEGFPHLGITPFNQNSCIIAIKSFFNVSQHFLIKLKLNPSSLELLSPPHSQTASLILFSLNLPHNHILASSYNFLKHTPSRTGLTLEFS